jgi:hypothetical protein
MKANYPLLSSFAAILLIYCGDLSAQYIEFKWVYDTGVESDRGSLLITQEAFESRSVSTDDVVNFYFDNDYFGIFEIDDLEFIQATISSDGSELISGSSRHSAGPSLWGYMLYLDFQFLPGVGGDEYQATGFGTDGLRSWSGSGSWKLMPELSCLGFAPPMAEHPVSFRGNHSLPLRAEIFTSNGDAIAGDELSAAPVVQVLFDPQTGADPIDVSDDVAAAGQSDEGNQFYYTEAGLWEFILETKSYTAKGTYAVLMVTGNSSEYVFENACVTEFVVQ